MISTTRLHPWGSTVHFPSLQPVSKTYYCTEQMLSWEAISLSVKKFHTLHEAWKLLPWIISHLQWHFPSSLYEIIITTFLKELASKTFWIFFVQRQWKKSSVKWYYYSCETIIRTCMLQFITIFFKVHINLVLLPSS